MVLSFGLCCLSQFCLHIYDVFQHAETDSVLQVRAAMQLAEVNVLQPIVLRI